jgi:hypothetical protein
MQPQSTKHWVLFWIQIFQILPVLVKMSGFWPNYKENVHKLLKINGWPNIYCLPKIYLCIFTCFSKCLFVTNSENSIRIWKIRYELGKFPLITLASLHDATISLDSSLNRAERNKYKMKTTIIFPICNLFHLWSNLTQKLAPVVKTKIRRSREKNPGIFVYVVV